MTLRLRLSLLVALLSLSAMLLFGTLAYVLFVRQQYRQLESLLLRDLERAQNSFISPAVGSRLSLSEAGSFRQQFVDKSGKVNIPPDAVSALPLELTPSVVRFDSTSFLVGSAPWKLSSGLELGTIRVALDISDALSVRRNLLQSLLLSGLVITASALGVGLWLLRRSLKPLSNLALEARKVNPAKPEMALYQGPNDEVAEVAKALNTALDGIRKRQEDERASLAEIAHELAAPLTLVAGHLESLSHDVKDNKLEAAKDAANELLYTSQDLLTLARGELEQPLTYTIVKLQDIITKMARAYPGIRTEVKSESTEVAGGEVAGNTERLTQLVRNLVRNAVQVSKIPEDVCVRLEAQEDKLLVTVRDKGMGIKNEDLPHIFERFYSKKGGVGVGLSIAQRIAGQHGGDIRVESVVGEGSVFTVTLPSLVSQLDEEEAQ
jgi:two-component system, OmpR family, sensor kinase